MERRLSELLGVSWTFEVDPNAIYPYGDSSRKEGLGYMIKTYATRAPLNRPWLV
jgi:hypothetical protein